MASEQPKVLISYSHDSAEHERRVLALANELRTQGGVDAWIDRYRPDPDEGWISWMRDHIGRADRVLLVFTETYARRFLGKEAPGKGLGVTFEGVIISQALYESGIHNAKFRAVVFREEDEGFIPLELRRVNRYRVDAPESYHKLLRWLHDKPEVEVPPVGPKPEFSPPLGQLQGVPDLPRHYSPRQGELAVLRQKLLAGDESVAITGMGGIGKTVLASALAHEPEVRQAFPDGIYWLTIGQKPNLLDLQNQLLRLTGHKETLTTEQEAKDALREALAGRRVFVILDDVWEVEHLQALAVTVSPACLLVTTRKQEVLVSLDAQEHPLRVLERPQSLRLLAEWTVKREQDKLPDEAAEVAQECGDLPLALAMIGAMVRMDQRPTAWCDALARLRRADLAAIKVKVPDYPYPDMLRAFEVSVEGLESVDRERYLDLAVFPEDQPVPERALSALWKLDDIDTRGCMARLATSSLAGWAMGESALLLHDLLRDLIHKRREKDLPGLHLRLVEAWNALRQLPDAYAWRWIGYHLMKAGCKDDLRRLLLDFNYLEAKLAATDANALIADYDYLAYEEELCLVQSTMRLSAHILARDPRQLAGQLIGRLLGDQTPVIQVLLEEAAGGKAGPWLRPLQPSLTTPGGPLIRTLEGHTGPIRAVAVTPDGYRVVSGSGDGTLRLWDLETGQTLRTLEGHTDPVRAVAVTPDGHRAVSGSGDGTLRLWDLERGQTLRTLKGHTGSVRAVAVTPDCRRIVSGSWDDTLRLWDLETGQTLRTLEGHRGSVRAVAVTPDGRRAVSGSEDGTLRLWDLERGQTLRTLEGHTGSVLAVAVTPDRYEAVSGSTDGTLRLWDLQSGQTLRTLKGHMGWVWAVAITSDGHRAVSGSSDGTLRLWDLESGQTLRILEGHTDPVRAVALSPDGHRAMSGSEDRTLRLWNLESGQKLRTPAGHAGRVNAVEVMPDGRRALAGSEDGTLRLWDLETGQTLRILEGHTGWVRTVAVTPDGHRAVSGSEDRTLRLWDLETGQTLRTLEGHTGSVRAVAVGSDGHRAVSGSNDGTLRLWDLESGQTLRTLKGRTDSVRAVAVSSDGHRAVSGSEDRTLRLWDLESGRTLRTLEGHTGSVLVVAITSDGHRAMSGSEDRTLRLWDLESGRTLRTLEGHTGSVRAVAVIPNGHRAVSGSEDRTLRLWDLEIGKVIVTFTGDGPMLSCAIAPNGQTIIAGDALGRVHFLRLVEADKTKPAIGELKIPLLLLKQESTDKPEKPTMPPPTRDQVFISYSHEDTKWREDFEKHLKPYLRAGSIKSWSDKQISPGSQWLTEIKTALTNTKVAVLLVTPDFIASDFIHQYELGPFLKEAKQGGVRILWVPVRASSYKKTALKDYQAVLDPAQPLANMTDAERDQAWVKICEEIEKAVNPQ